MNYVLSYRESLVDGRVTSGYLSAAQGRHGWPHAYNDIKVASVSAPVVFLIHGDNVNAEDGESSLKKLMARLTRNTASVMVAVLWPGDHWTGPISYPFESRDADDTADGLVTFIDSWLAPGATVMFFAHSLGARVAMHAASVLATGGFGGAIGEICLLTPAIDDNSLTQRYRRGTERSQRVAVL